MPPIPSSKPPTPERDEKRCLIPSCLGRKQWKGLCPRCYKSAKAVVESKKTTWEELAAKGLAEIDDSTTFMDEFNKRMNGG